MNLSFIICCRAIVILHRSEDTFVTSTVVIYHGYGYTVGKRCIVNDVRGGCDTPHTFTRQDTLDIANGSIDTH